MDDTSDDGALRIELPEGATPDLTTFVYDELGVMPLVAGPVRGLPEVAPVVVWIGEALAAGLIGAAGERALARVVARLRRSRDEQPRPVLVVRGDRRPVLTFVFGDGAGTEDLAAVHDLLVIDRSRFGDAVHLYRVSGAWVDDAALGD
jgi:hypothetical protein